MTTTSYRGIDYSGHTKVNRDLNGIRYGVINQNAVGQAWFDDSEAYFGSIGCPYCGYENDTLENWPDTCKNCGFEFQESELEFLEPVSYHFQDNEYSAEADDCGDIFITESPYFTYAQFCSPCAPGAVHLENPLDHKPESNKGYCFGHDWFETGKAPYLVYSIKTGKLV